MRYYERSNQEIFEIIKEEMPESLAFRSENGKFELQGSLDDFFQFANNLLDRYSGIV
jgi:hypothetical protein